LPFFVLCSRTAFVELSLRSTPCVVRRRYFSSVGLGVSAAEGPAISRPENSQMMIASAISPTRPASPSDLTSAIMFVTTSPKNGRFAPTRSVATIASANSKSPTSVSAPIHFLTVSVRSPPLIQGADCSPSTAMPSSAMVRPRPKAVKARSN